MTGYWQDGRETYPQGSVRPGRARRRRSSFFCSRPPPSPLALGGRSVEAEAAPSPRLPRPVRLSTETTGQLRVHDLQAARPRLRELRRRGRVRARRARPPSGGREAQVSPPRPHPLCLGLSSSGTFLRIEHGRQPLITVRGTTLAEMLVGQPALPSHPSPTMAWGSYSEGPSWGGGAFVSPTDVAAGSALRSDSRYHGSALRFEDNVHYGASYVFGETHQVVRNNLFLAEGDGACGGQGACPGTRMLQLKGSGTLRFEGNLLAGNRVGGWIEHGCDGLAEHWRAATPRRRTSSRTNLTGPLLSLSLSRPRPPAGAATSRPETSSAGTSPAAAARCRSTRSATRSASPRTASRGASATRSFALRAAAPRARVSLSPTLLRTYSSLLFDAAGGVAVGRRARAASRTSSRSRTRTATSRSTRASTRRARSSRTRARPRRSGSSRARPRRVGDEA